jgi:leucyl-tRNA synthetase
VKSVGKIVDKADMKRAMPFIQDLKRKLESGENSGVVLDRVLGFDETVALREMIPVLKSAVPKLREVDIIVVNEDATVGNEAGAFPQLASSAEPGNPSLEFSNV